MGIYIEVFSHTSFHIELGCILYILTQVAQVINSGWFTRSCHKLLERTANHLCVFIYMEDFFDLFHRSWIVRIAICTQSVKKGLKHIYNKWGEWLSWRRRVRVKLRVWIKHTQDLETKRNQWEHKIKYVQLRGRVLVTKHLPFIRGVYYKRAYSCGRYCGPQPSDINL